MVIFQFFLRPRFGSEEVHRNFKGSDSSGKVSHKAVWNKGKANLGKVWRLFYFTGIKNPVGPKILRKLERTSGSVRESELYLLPLPMDSPGTSMAPHHTMDGDRVRTICMQVRFSAMLNC